MKKEAILQAHVADYLRLRYPNVIFHSDYGSGIRLTPGQAMMQKRQNGGRRAWPDMFIARATDKYHGLFIELKKDGTRILKKDGTLVADQHIREQFDMLIELEQEGYKAVFGVGFQNTKQIIDEYLGGPVEEGVEF